MASLSHALDILRWDLRKEDSKTKRRLSQDLSQDLSRLKQAQAARAQMAGATSLNDFKQLALLGEGAYSAVYKASTALLR